MTEVWLPVPGWEHRYQVSNQGRVRSLDIVVPARNGKTAMRRGRVLKAAASHGRYLVVMFADQGRMKQWSVHNAVLTAFVGPRPEGMQARHLDGNDKNNRLENLCWGAPQENADDRVRHGKSGKGEAHSRVVLTEADVLAIRAATGVRGADLARQYGIYESHVHHIRTRKIWKHI